MPAARPRLVRQLAVILGIFVASCGPVATEGSSTTSLWTDSSTTTSTPVPAIDDVARQLAEARGRWVTSSPETYHFVLQDDCGECDPDWAQPRRIVVWDGTVLDPTRNDTDIEALFSLLEAAIQDGRPVEAEYDPELGHPTEIWIDREARAYDGGTHLIVHELAIGLPGDNVSLADLVDSLFRQIEQWEADGWDTDVLYDQRLGHPVPVTAMRGDDSTVFSIEGFRPG